MITVQKTTSAGILPAVPRASRPRRGEDARRTAAGTAALLSGVTALEAAQKVHDLTFCPITVVITAITAVPHSSARFHRYSYKSAVSSILGLDQSDVLIRQDLPSRLRRDVHERIIRRVQYQRRHRDPLDHVHRRSAVRSEEHRVGKEPRP